MATKKLANSGFALGTVWGITAPQQTTSQPGAVITTAAPARSSSGLTDNTPHAATSLTVEFCDVVFKNLATLESYLNTIKGGSGLEICKNVKIGYRAKAAISLGMLFHIADVDPQLIDSLTPTSLTNFKLNVSVVMTYRGIPFNLAAIFRNPDAPGILLYRGNAEREFIGALMRLPPRTIDLET